MNNRKIFLFWYLGGIIFTIVIGLGIVTTRQGSWFLFGESIIHMGILIFLAVTNNSTAFKIYAGERIQTAGYLHTLIGFAVAIGLLAVGDIKINTPEDLNKMLLAIASALVSSIIGWSFGGEIAYKEDTSRDTDKLDQAIKDMTKVFQRIEKIQENTLNTHLQELRQFDQERNQILEEKLENLVLQIQNKNQSIIEVFNQLNSVIQGESDSLRETFQQFNSSIQTSSESLLDSFNRLNSVVESESQSLPQSFNRLSSVIENQSNSLSYTFNKLSSVIETTSHSLSTNLNSLEVETQKAVGSMSNTAQSVQDLADDLSQILVLIQQLEELIKYVLQERSKKL